MLQKKEEKANYSNIHSKELNFIRTGKSLKRKQQNQSKGNNSVYDICIYIYSRRLLQIIKLNTILPQIKWN